MNSLKTHFIKFFSIFLISLTLILGSYSNTFATNKTPDCVSGGANCNIVASPTHSGWNSFTEKVGDIFKFIFGIKDKVGGTSTPPSSGHLPLAGEEKTPPPQVVNTPPTTIIQQITQAGLTGNTGPQGLRGFTGPQGPKGDKGESGISSLASPELLTQAGFVTKSFFDKQVDAIYNSTNKNISGLSTSLAKEINTKLLTVTGDATIGGNILLTGTILGSNISGLTSGSNTGDETNSTILTKLGLSSISGVNTGDNAINSLYSGLATSKQDALSGTGFVKISGTTISYDNSTYLTSLTGAVLTSQTTPQTIGLTGSRLSKLYATDLDVTNIITGSISGNAGTVTNGAYTNTANTFTNPAPMTTLAESWIGPSSTTGIYFKDGNVGIGTITPTSTLTVQGDSLIIGALSANTLNAIDKSATRANLGLSYATNTEATGQATYFKNITIWGDSLSFGFYNSSSLATLSGATVNNGGVGGNTSTQIAVRQGGVVTTVTVSGGQIPTSGGVTVTFPSGYEPVTSVAPSSGVLGTIQGIYGRITYSNGVLTFTRQTSGVAVNVSGAVPFTVDTNNLNNDTVIIWAGTNNDQNTAQVESDIAGMVSSLGHSRYIVLSTLGNALSRIRGTGGYTLMMQLNSDLSSIYGDHFIDVHTYLESQYDPNNAQDVIDYNNDVTPSSLRADNIHLNITGYGLVAQLIYQKLENMKAETAYSNSIITPSNIPSIFSSPNVIGLTSPSSAFFTKVGIGTISPIAKLDILAGNLNLDNTTFANQYGVITKNGTPFIHDFNYGLNSNGITTTGQNTFVGISAGNLTMGSTATLINQSSRNTGIGNGSLFSNTTGYGNTAIGFNSLLNNTTGLNNTANGLQALYFNTEGFLNTANGMYSLYSNTIGYDNTANGAYSLNLNTTGNSNTASGMYSLSSNTTGSQGVAFGVQAMQYVNNTTTAWTNKNTAIGFSALRGSTTAANNTGNSNTGIGYGSLSVNTAGSYNTSIGDSSLGSNTIGSSNTANGYQALLYNTSSYNTATGAYSFKGSAATTGSFNTSNGAYSLTSTTTGSNNTANGYQALQANTTGFSNTANGYQALQANTTGFSNTANGYASLYYAGKNVTAGSFIIGVSYTITSAGNTDFVALSAENNNVGTVFTSNGAGNGTGTAASNSNNNTAYGYNAGKYINGGTALNAPSNSLFLGYETRASADGLTNENVIGYGAIGSGSNTIKLGNNAITGTYLDGSLAKILGMDRHKITNTAGNGLTLQAGGATLGATNKNGGDLNLKSAISTGTGDSALRFFTATPATTGTADNTPTEKMTILGSGFVGIGIAIPTNILHVTGTPVAGTHVARIANTLNGTTQNNGLLILAGNDSGLAASEMITFKSPNNTTIGTITQTGAGSIGFNSGSDRRIKDEESIKPTTFGLSDLLNIKVDDFTFISDPNKQKMTGFIAQELNSIYPNAVTTNGDNGTDALAQGQTPWMIDYSKLTPLLVKSVQDMDLKVEGLASLDTTSATSLGSLITKFLADMGNNVTDLYASVVHSDKVETNMLCVGTTCVTEDQFLEIVNKSGITTGTQGGGGDQSNNLTPEKIEAARVAKIATDLATIKTSAGALTEANYNESSWTTFSIALVDALKLPEDTEANKIDKTTAITNVIARLQAKEVTPPAKTCELPQILEGDTCVDPPLTCIAPQIPVEGACVDPVVIN